MNKYTDYYIKKYLWFFEKANVDEFKYNYINENECVLETKKNKDKFHLIKKNDVINYYACNYNQFRKGIFLYEHVLIITKIHNL